MKRKFLLTAVPILASLMALAQTRKTDVAPPPPPPPTAVMIEQPAPPPPPPVPSKTKTQKRQETPPPPAPKIREDVPPVPDKEDEQADSLQQ